MDIYRISCVSWEHKFTTHPTKLFFKKGNPIIKFMSYNIFVTFSEESHLSVT